MSLLPTQIAQLVNSARPHAKAALIKLEDEEDAAISEAANHAARRIRDLPEKKRYGLLEQAAGLIEELSAELRDLKKMKAAGYRERFPASNAELECVRMLEIRYRVNGMAQLMDAAQTLKKLRFRIERTWSAPARSVLPERHRAKETDCAEDDEAISPALLKMVARKNASLRTLDKEKWGRSRRP